MFDFSQQRLANKHWEDNVSVGTKGGFKLSEGGSIVGSLLHRAGVGLSISISPTVTLTETSTYLVASRQQADAMVLWSLGRFGLEQLGLPGLGQLVAPTLNSEPAHRGVPAPKKSELKLEGALEHRREPWRGKQPQWIARSRRRRSNRA